MRVITTDVAVIGGGAAGCYAALDLNKQGIKPLIICKGLVGKSGASLFAGNLVISGRALGNSDENARNTAEFLIKYHNQFLIDQDWAQRCGQWLEKVYYPELEEAGLYIRRDDYGEVVTSPGKIRSIAANVQGNSGVPFMDLRRKQVIRAGIARMEETVATALLSNADGSVGGVFCLNCITGEYTAVMARAVIMATGYSDRLHTRSTGTREMSGDGIAMAWRLGATLLNMEMQWWHTNDLAHPPSWQRMQINPNPMLGSEKSARMLNSAGDEFFNQQQDDPLAFGPYTVQLKALVKQVRAGRARYDGGYYAGFDKCDAAEVEKYTTYGKTFRQLGTMRSSIPGLYAAGGVGGHSNGLIGLATYDGRTVAEGVARDIADIKAASVPQQQLETECSRLERLRSSSGDGPAPGKLKEELRAVMWKNVGVEKNASDLRSALDDIDRIRVKLLPGMKIRNTAKSANYEWLDAIDLMNMIDVCELVIHSSLERKESRGPFLRQDFPLTDNDNWLAANVLKKSGNGLRFEKRPYSLPLFAPGFSRKDNLEVAW
jgi:succinate dehydrogenase / fumarate reductase flavoprotein subunit